MEARLLNNPDPYLCDTIFDFRARNLNGEIVELKYYEGHVCLVVNVASKCGISPYYYKQLNKLHEKYAEDYGLRILAFPCNQLGNQEPGDTDELIEYMEKMQVKFDVFQKVLVNSIDAHPLWKFLKFKIPSTFGSVIKWNFTKFITDEKGVPVARHEVKVQPMDLEPYFDELWGITEEMTADKKRKSSLKMPDCACDKRFVHVPNEMNAGYLVNVSGLKQKFLHNMDQKQE